jgi:type I restriction enzyme R subunit
MVALDAVIEKINDLFADDTPTDSLGGVIAPAMGRLTRNATLLQQSASNSLAQFSASPDLHREFMDAFLDSHETAGDIVAQIVNKPETFQKVIEALVPVLYAELTKAAGK